MAFHYLIQAEVKNGNLIFITRCNGFDIITHYTLEFNNTNTTNQRQT